MNGEVGRDMNEASQTRSIVDNIVTLYSQKSKSGASNFESNSNNQKTSSSNTDIIRDSFRDIDSSILRKDASQSEIANATKSPYGNSFTPGQSYLNLSGSFSLAESYQLQQVIPTFHKDHQKMQLIQLQQEQQHLRMQQQLHEQQQLRLQQLQRQTEFNLQSPKQHPMNSPQRHNREYIGGAAAAAYNALRHDYYTAKQDGQPENLKTSQTLSSPPPENSDERQQPKTPSSGTQLPQGFPNFVRTDPRE
jgi:hypothetical protein